MNPFGDVMTALFVITPILAARLSQEAALTLGWSGVMLIVCHVIARRILRGLED